MSFEDMIDLDINANVTALKYGCGDWEFNGVEFYHCGIDGSGYFSQPVIDYCNSISEAWSIIIKNEISIMNDGDMWEASIDFDGDLEKHGTDEVLTKYYEHKNPLRAAMVVFLMMQGQA